MNFKQLLFFSFSKTIIQALTVQLYLIQSSQNRLAENFFLTTTVRPWRRHCPTPMILPEVKGKKLWLCYVHNNGIPGELEATVTHLLSDRAADSHK